MRQGARVVGSAVFVFVAALFIPVSLRAQRTDVIHGRITGPDSAGIASAAVMVIDTVAKVLRPPVQTDASGNYSVPMPDGSGVYALSVSMVGYAPQRRIVARQPDGSMPAADFKLVAVVRELGPVKSVAQRPRVARAENGAEGGIGASVTYQGLGTGLNGDVTGDLNAALSMMPGITITPDAAGGLPSVSAFGLSSDQNGLVLNGLGFGGQVPRDGFRLAVLSSTYDPSRGGFAGVQLSLRMNGGNSMTTRSLHATLDAPQLQVTTPVASRLGTRYNQQVVSGTASGPIVFDRSYYALSYQVTHRTNPLNSLLNADSASLAAVRLSSDSAARLMAVLPTLGIPSTTSRVPGSRDSKEIRVAGRFDFLPTLQPSRPGLQYVDGTTIDDYTLEVGGTFRSNGGNAIGPTSLPAAGSEQWHRDGWLQFTAANYLPKSILNEASLSVNGAEDRGTPYLDLPSGRVLVTSNFDAGTPGLSSVLVGGSGTHSDGHTWATELRNQTSWYSWNRVHSFSATLDATADGFTSQQNAGYGSFAFNSLADFSNGVPASFSRTLTNIRSSGTGTAWAVGVGEVYAPNNAVTRAQALGLTPPPPLRPTVQYGVRVEGNRYGIHPAYNPTVDSVFHLRTDFVPSAVRVMPMIGFTWNFLPEYKIPQVGINFGRRATLSGGVREYRGTLSTRSISAYTQQTGLPNAIQQLYCVGSAAPIPDWTAYAGQPSTIPEECANGAASTPLAQTVPPVSLFARDYANSESWRPTLSLSYILTSFMRVGLNGTYALNRHSAGIYDANFDGQTKFTLPDEGNRPVFVPTGSIVPATGVASWVDSRRSALFSHVSESRSDLRSNVRTVGGSASWSPFVISPNSAVTSASLSYTFSDGREQLRGFNGTTSGNPADLFWSSSSVAKHTVTLSLYRRVPNLVNIALQGRIQSGLPYTPIIAGDVNGDGYSNDRAFLFNPASVADTGLANGMTRLLNAGGGARRCLQGQQGRIAGRNSCTGPWSMPLLSMSITPDPYRIGLGSRGSINLLFTNILSGLDQTVHGSGHLHGWGQYAYVDPMLLTVRGFDPSARRYTYAVNPLFGSSSQFRNTFRSPFTLTIDARFDIAPNNQTQLLNNLLRVGPADPGPLNAVQIKTRITRLFNPIDQLVSSKDSLHLTTEQIDSLNRISQRSLAKRDSIAMATAKYLESLHGNYDGPDVRARWQAAALESYTEYLHSLRAATGVLTPEQFRRLSDLPQLRGLATITSYKDSDLPTMFRGGFASFP